MKRTGSEERYKQWWIEKTRQQVAQMLAVQGLTFAVAKDVFSPSTTTTYSVDLLLRNFPDVTDKRVLDIGTGCGVLALRAAARGAKEVIATDVSSAALDNATQNVAAAGFAAVVSGALNHWQQQLLLQDLAGPVLGVRKSAVLDP